MQKYIQKNSKRNRIKIYHKIFLIGYFRLEKPDFHNCRLRYAYLRLWKSKPPGYMDN
jgi:hypothetical protein